MSQGAAAAPLLQSSVSLPQLPCVLAFDGSRQLGEFALVVSHLQVLNVVTDVAGTPKGDGDVRVFVRERGKVSELTHNVDTVF